MPTVVISASGRGIGFEFARQYVESGWRVIATYRETAPPAVWLSDNQQQVEALQLDVADPRSIDALAKELHGKPVDMVINNAAYMSTDQHKQHEQLGSLDADAFDRFFQTNARGPVMLVEALLPNLYLGRIKKVVTISSELASLTLADRVPGAYWYKASKCAVNRLMQSLAMDLRADGITVLALHPGLVLTERIAHRRAELRQQGQGWLEPDEAVARLRQVIDSATLAHSGQFLDNAGNSMA